MYQKKGPGPGMYDLFFLQNQKWSGHSETQNKHVIFFQLWRGLSFQGLKKSSLRKFSLEIGKNVYKKKYLCTFPWEKQVELKNQIMA